MAGIRRMAQQQNLLFLQSQSADDQPIHAAGRMGHIKCCHRLLRSGVRPANRTYLYCVSRGQINVCRMLIERNVDINCTDTCGCSALACALYSSDSHFVSDRAMAQLVRSLSSAGADILGPISDALGPAAMLGFQETVAALLTAGADVNARGSDNRTPLQHAAAAEFSTNAEIVKMLLEAGADCNVSDKTRGTPLLIVCGNRAMRSIGTLQTLLRFGATVDPSGCVGVCPLLSICRRPIADTDFVTDAVRLLLDAGADVNASDAFGDTPITVATAGGHDAAAELLRKEMASILRAEHNSIDS